MQGPPGIGCRPVPLLSRAYNNALSAEIFDRVRSTGAGDEGHGNVMEQLTMEEPLRLTDTLSVSVSRRNPWVPLSMSSKIDLGYVERRAGSRRPPRRVDLSHRQGPSQRRPTLWHREAGEGRTRASIGRKAAGSASPGAYSGDREHSVRRRRGPKLATLFGSRTDNSARLHPDPWTAASCAYGSRGS